MDRARDLLLAAFSLQTGMINREQFSWLFAEPPENELRSILAERDDAGIAYRAAGANPLLSLESAQPR